MFLYSPESVYGLDRAAVEIDGYSEIELMQRAGRRLWREIDRRWPNLARVSIFAGSGNNGGDAFVAALEARAQGIDVQLLVQGDLARQSPTSRHFRDRWERDGGRCEAWGGQAIDGELIVDGLLGIGLQRELDADWQALVRAINALPCPRVAIDIPSGLDGRCGIAHPVAVDADMTVTFIGRKSGQFLGDGPDYCGELVFDDLGVSGAARAGATPALEVIEGCRLPAPRRRNSHKNHFGHLLIVGGDQGMSGAVALAASAAMRGGAGLVTALVHPDCRQALASRPEVMTLGWDALDEKLEAASVVVVGPGLGDTVAARECLRRLQAATQPMVIDASALDAGFLDAIGPGQRIITPHPGEAARLLETTSGEVQADRLAACQRLQERFGMVTVLKGSGTLVGAPGSGPPAINTRGNPGMASAGMGDVLSGLTGALLGQGLDPASAARSAVYLHALGAEACCDGRDQNGLLASDIIEVLPAVMHGLRGS